MDHRAQRARQITEAIGDRMKRRESATTTISIVHKREVPAVLEALALEQTDLAALCRRLARQLSAAEEFFTEFVPLRDHNGRSLHEDWSWGDAQAALREARIAGVLK